MKIIFFKLTAGQKDALSQYLGNRAELRSIDNEAELINELPNLHGHVAIAIAKSESETTKKVEEEIMNRSSISIVEVDNGDKWQQQIDLFMELDLLGGELSLSADEDLSLSLDADDSFEEVHTEREDDLSFSDVGEDLSLSLGGEDSFEEAQSERADDLSFNDTGLDSLELSLGGDSLEEDEELQESPDMGGLSFDDESDEGGLSLSLASEEVSEEDDLSLGSDELDNDLSDDSLSLSFEGDLVDDSEDEPPMVTQEMSKSSLNIADLSNESDDNDGLVMISDESDEDNLEDPFQIDSDGQSERDEDDDDDISIEDIEAILEQPPAEIHEAEDFLSLDTPLTEELPDFSEPVVAASAPSEQVLDQYSETIKQLREDRERFLLRVEELEIEKEKEKRRQLSLEAELEEKKIEIALTKRRFADDYEKMKAKLATLEQKEQQIKEKNFELSKEFEKLNKKAYLDLKKIQLREQELDNQLGLLKTDTDSQIRNRDIIILDLKRKIDVLEFDIEQSWKHEKAAKKEKLILQNKIDRLIVSLRNVVENVDEDDIDDFLKNDSHSKK